MLSVGRPQRNIVKFEFSIQRSPADTQHSSRERLIASRLFEYAQYGHALQIRQRGRRELGIRSLRFTLRRHANARRQIAYIDRVMVPERNRTRDAILKLSHISGPVILQETLHRVRRHLDIFSRRIAVQETMRKLRYIGAAFSQAGQMHGDNIQTKIEVLAKRGSAKGGFQIAV